MQESFLKVRYFERGLSKSLKKGKLFFLSNPVPFNSQNYQKNGPGTSEPVAIQVTKQVQKNSFISYVLSDQV